MLNSASSRVGLATLIAAICLPGGDSLLGADADALPFRYPEAKHAAAELRFIDHTPVLIVQGSPEEMGAQLGELAFKPALGLMNSLDEFVKTQGLQSSYPLLLKSANLLVGRLPPVHLKELDAVAKTSGWPRELLIFGNTFADLRVLAHNCSALMIESGRSTSGGPLFGRNLDWPPFGNIHEYPLVVVYRPAGKRAFASIALPGMIGCTSGMNDAGLALADLTVTSSNDGSPKLNMAGTPYMLTLRRVLEECATVGDAEKLLRSMTRTTMQNLAICDPNQAAVFEITTKNIVVRRETDGICACTNHFRTPELATFKECRRYEILDESRKAPKLGITDVARAMDAVNQGAATMQTMVFEPKTRTLHLAYGKGPATRLPLRRIELHRLFAEGKFDAKRAAPQSN